MSVNGILLGQNNNNIEISEQNSRTAGSYSYTIPKTGWYYILMSGGGGGGQANGRNIESNQGGNGGNGWDGFIIIVSL